MYVSVNKTIQARKMPQKDIFIIKDSTLYYIVTQDQLRIRTWIWDMVLSLTTPVSEQCEHYDRISTNSKQKSTLTLSFTISTSATKQK